MSEAVSSFAAALISASAADAVARCKDVVTLAALFSFSFQLLLRGQILEGSTDFSFSLWLSQSCWQIVGSLAGADHRRRRFSAEYSLAVFCHAAHAFPLLSSSMVLSHTVPLLLL